MDLNIKDIAELLNVTETTVHHWLKDGKIPAYKMNHQDRFNIKEIENWVMSHKLKNPSSPGECQVDVPVDASIAIPQGSKGSKQFGLYRAIHKGGVLNLDFTPTSKEKLIRPVMKRIAHELHVDGDAIGDMLLAREALQSTGLNNGIAIPHTRDFLLNTHSDVVTVVFPENPMPYEALDGKPVHTLFFLFASDDKRHLHLLAKIAHLSSQPEAQELLRSRPSKEQLLDYIKDWESSL